MRKLIIQPVRSTTASVSTGRTTALTTHRSAQTLFLAASALAILGVCVSLSIADSPPRGRDIHDWPTYSHDNAHSGYSDTTGPTTNNVLWTYTTGGDVDSSPAVVAGKVYFGSRDNNVYCLNAETGDLVWTYETEGDVPSSPTVAGGKIYIGSWDCNLYCLDAETGDYLWSYGTNDWVNSPVVDNDKVYFSNNDGFIYCLSAGTGSFVWSYSVDDFIEGCPAIEDEHVYFGANDGKMYCLNANTGAFVWSYATLAPVTSSPAVVYNKVFFVSTDCKLYSLRADDAYEYTTYTFSGGNNLKSCPAVCLSGRVYIGTNASPDAMFGLDTQLRVQWRSDIGSCGTSSPAVADGMVYIGVAGSYRVYCLDAYSGDEIWNYQTGGRVWSSPAVADGRVYIGSCDNKLYCFGDPPMPPVAEFQWAPEYPVIGEPVAFDASDSHDPDGSITSYEWDWDNDGIYDESHTTPTATWQWDEAGDKAVTLRVTDNEDLQGTVTHTVPVGSGSDPNTPSNPDPADLAVDVSGDADLSWDGGDADSHDSVTYAVYFGTEPSPPLVETIGPYPATQTRITYAGDWGSITTYYWKVVACDNHEHCTEGPIWSFTTVEFSPMIGHAPSSLTNECQEGEDAPDQAFEVWNNGGGGTLEYAITVEECLPEPCWLWVDPLDGTSDGEHNTHTVHYNTASLACGDYSATITISDPDAINNPQTIAVELTVTGQPSIGLDTYLLNPECQEGEDAPDQIFEVWNDGKCTLDYTITVDYTPPGDNWILPIELPGGTLGSGDDPITHTVSYSTAGLEAGDYSATITIEDPEADNNPQVIEVELSVLSCYLVAGAIYDEWVDPHLHGVADVTVTIEGEGGTFVVCTDDSGSGIWGMECVPEGTYTIMPTMDGCEFYEVEGGSQGDPAPITLLVNQDYGSIKFFAVCEPGACYMPGEVCISDVDHDTCAGIPDAVYQGNGSTCEDPCAYEDCNANARLDSVDVGTCASEDCQPNGIPDECDIDPTDPDGNGQVSPDDNGNGIPDECEVLLGDLNCDGEVDMGDVSPFVLTLLDATAYGDAYPNCYRTWADCNGDDDINGLDVQSFIELLIGG